MTELTWEFPIDWMLSLVLIGRLGSTRAARQAYRQALDVSQDRFSCLLPCRTSEQVQRFEMVQLL